MKRRREAVLAGAILLIAAAAPGHPPPRATTRELVRLQGHRTQAASPEVKRRLVLVALGVEQPFAVTDWQVFGFSDTPSATPQPADTSQRFVLQGSRDTLARLAAVRPEQTVTLLAERRPGSTELFVLTLDVCPPR
jgi:hypothetical protein